MPKRIEFIAPVEAMRGNLSGRQVLEYQLNNNPASEAPAGSTSYARNYTTRFIGAKRVSDGLKYFAVKTKTATTLSPRALQVMALLGGTGALVGSILANKSSEVYANLYAQWLELRNISGYTDSFRKAISSAIRTALENNSVLIIFAGPRPAVTFNNPWAAFEQTPGATVSQTILVKFWDQLCNQAANFTVDGKKGIYPQDSVTTFDQLIAKPLLNVLGLAHSDEDEFSQYLKYNDRYILDPNGNYVKGSTLIVDGGKYTTVSESPA